MARNLPVIGICIRFNSFEWSIVEPLAAHISEVQLLRQYDHVCSQLLTVTLLDGTA